MAGKKSTVYYSTANPSGTGTTTGDVWRKIDGSKNVIGEWYWNGSGWQASQITTQMISNLDVGKLTSGTAAINNAVISKLFAEIFAAKKISATEADIQSLTAAVAQIIQLDVSQLVVTGSGTFNEAVIKKLWAQTLTVVDLIADAINGKTIKGNLISGADIEGSTFRLLGDQSGPGSGSGYDFEINRDNGGAYLGFHIGGETTPGTIRVFDSDPAYATDQPRSSCDPRITASTRPGPHSDSWRAQARQGATTGNPASTSPATSLWRPNCTESTRPAG
jgi:hypothetical protein